MGGGDQDADAIHVKYNLFVFFLVSLELCPGSTVWRPRASIAHPLAHSILMLREPCNVSVLDWRKWTTELLVPRVTFIHLFIPWAIMESTVCCALASYWLW